MLSSSRTAAPSAASSRHAKPTRTSGKRMTRVRLDADGSVVELLADGGTRRIAPRADWSRADAVTEADIARHAAEDDADGMRDAAAWARRVRRRLGLSQTDFARRIQVPVATVRNWEQGKRAPRGPARALLRLIDRAPAAALAALRD